MKKRSMLALASLATGFVVAAVSPSHAVDHDGLGDRSVKDIVGTVDQVVGEEGLATGDDASGQHHG
ncbi:hypothetical protein ACIOC2_24190 [Streptomyces sp. NPDC088337]|uniref:hypothetical protein n=1 Tax=unclassified Streptomyces TaxID=2593676 RepID=UPI002DD7D005|nr:hypothetical protein [Streptomyces sp. NBC_01788]WSB25342.1 hypothetical protein OIE49_05325 [Streptomyces sp. NBC_01788]